MVKFNSMFAGDANESLGFLFVRVYHLWERKIKKALRKYQLTQPQFVVLTTLAYLGQNETEVTQVMLSRASDIDVMTISTILKNLQKSKLISRTESATDTRSKVVKLTTEGESLVNETLPVVEAVDASFFPQTKERQKQLQEVLLELLKGEEHD